MDIQIAKQRIKDVLNVDSINSSKADFLITHVPFRQILVKNNFFDDVEAEKVSEEVFFSKHFLNQDIYNKHQLIVVEGSSGSGKSHFIRWINAKLESLENFNDVVLLIRRSDNTLKGTIKQFLDIEEIQNLKNKEVYDRLVKANQNISEKRFKQEIYHKFLVEIASEEEQLLERTDRKNFRELLASTEFEERMLMVGGPIDRIYTKIVDDDSSNNEDIVALFEESDFILDYDFNERLKNNASKRAVKIANKLLPMQDGEYIDEDCNPIVLADYMNSKVEQVIQSCAGIEPGDFQQIFKEIRKELYIQGKNLILLIEDITSCTGINRDLLNALIVEHTGINEKENMCRLLSVIGTTSAYFDDNHIRDNYIDRITTQILIEDGTLGNTTDDLIQFVAKYLNAISLNEEKVDKWYKNGALESEYPVYKEANIRWENYNYNNNMISLYPFTKKAIVNLYNNMDEHRTPRYIIRKIIEPAILNLIEESEAFPIFLKHQRKTLAFDVEARIKSIIANMNLSGEVKENYQNRVLALVSFWGNGNLEVLQNKIGGINTSIFVEFGLSDFAKNVLGKEVDKDDNNGFEDDNTNDLEVIEIEDEKPKEQKNVKFDDFTKMLIRWKYDEGNYTRANDVRDEINSFIIGTISWLKENVSLKDVSTFESSSYKLISIVRQDRAADKGEILLEDTEETYQLLLCFGKWLYVGKKTWNYDGASSDIRFVTGWLERNKKQFVDAIKSRRTTDDIPDYIRCAMIAEIYRCLLNGDNEYKKVKDISVEVFLKGVEDKRKKDATGHSDIWKDVIDNIIYNDNRVVNNNELISDYFDLRQGIRRGSKTIIKYSILEKYFKIIKEDNFEVKEECLDSEKLASRNESIEYFKKIYDKVDFILDEEIKEAKKVIDELLYYFGFQVGTKIESDDIIELLNEAKDFYSCAESNGIILDYRYDEINKFKTQSTMLAKKIDAINIVQKEKNRIEKLIIFSENPLKDIKKLLELFKIINDDVEIVNEKQNKEKSQLTRSGNWADEFDPRFDEKEEDLGYIINVLEA